MRRSLILLLIIIGGFTVPPLLSTLFPSKLPDAALTIAETPRPLPTFTFSDGSGRALTLDRFNGTVVLLNVWATWCGPCQKEMPALDRLAQLVSNQDIKVVPISIDDSGAAVVRPFYGRLGLDNLPIYVDPSKRVMDALRITGIPTTLLIGRDGREIGRMVGPAEWDAPASVKQLSELAGN